MYQEVKSILEFFRKVKAAKFSYIYRELKLGLAEREQIKIKRMLIETNIVNVKSDMGIEPRYGLTDYGNKELDRMHECENLDRILKYLDENRHSFPDIKEVCEQCDVAYDRIYALRLERDGYIENIAKSKDGDGFKITKNGEYFINIEGGFCAELQSEIEDAILGESEPAKPLTSETISIKAENVIYNKDSITGNQSQKVNDESKRKTNWLQIIVWIITIAIGLISIYKFVIN